MAVVIFLFLLTDHPIAIALEISLQIFSFKT